MKTIKGIFDGTCVQPMESIAAAPNSEVLITYTEAGETKRAAGLMVRDVAGCLKYNGTAASVADMHRAVEEEARSRRN